MFKYIFRSGKPKFCYHIATGRGTACRMERSSSFALLDARSDTPPPGRPLCENCAKHVADKSRPMSPPERIENALALAMRYGGVDGAHHKDWLIDQMVRALLGSKDGEETAEYADFVAEAEAGEDGPGTYLWDVGIAP